MSKRERLNKLMRQYMEEHDPEIVMTLRWNLDIDEIIELLENREGKEIIALYDQDEDIDDAPITYAYK